MAATTGMLDVGRLEELATAIECGLVGLPVTAVQLGSWPRELREQAVAVVAGLGGEAAAVVAALRLAARARRAEREARPAPELVWAAHGRANTRGVTAVARELIARAERELLAMTYSFGELDGPNPVFVELRKRLLESRPPRVRVVLGKVQNFGEALTWEALRDRATGRLLRAWPGPPYPELYLPHGVAGAVPLVHAKLVMCDQREVLLTSANLNSSGLGDNVEVGVHLRDAVFARQLQMGVDQLVETGVLIRAY